MLSKNPVLTLISSVFPKVIFLQLICSNQDPIKVYALNLLLSLFLSVFILEQFLPA